ncbi:MAG: cell filamentation protein Fic, partial [Deltaproteobacteria bacterium]|nr:cell filamentation protein Fic [Deltaproteobacteria bacterium]
MNKNEIAKQQSDFLLYTSTDGKIKIDAVLQDENIWLTQKAMGELFGKERSVITKHIKNIFSSGELEE